MRPRRRRLVLLGWLATLLVAMGLAHLCSALPLPWWLAWPLEFGVGWACGWWYARWCGRDGETQGRRAP